jgi:SET domain-containing protein
MKTLPHTNVFCRLGCSKIHGVGVFAITDIPKGTVIFKGNEPATREVSKADVDALPKNIQKLYHDFGVFNGSAYICPEDFGELSVGWFFNNSDKPNIDCQPFRSRTDGFKFVASRDIQEGDELFVDYNKYEKDYLLLHSKALASDHQSARVKRGRAVGGVQAAD